MVGQFRQITVIGVGLLGGSVGLAAKAADERIRVVGVGRRASSIARALAAGAIDHGTLDLAEGIAGSDLIVLATPLPAYEAYFKALAAALARGWYGSGAVCRGHVGLNMAAGKKTPAAMPPASLGRRASDAAEHLPLITDVGSTKAGVVKLAGRILGRGPGAPGFVGSHPMAGSERQGVEFARADLFVNATCIITPTPDTPPGLIKSIEGFWQMLGGQTVRLSPDDHDQAVARVSHLPHLLAAMLVRLQRAGSEDLAGMGFLDTTRIASGDPVMWREILFANRKAMLKAIDQADGQLARLRQMIATGDAAAMEKYLAAAKVVRDELKARRARQEQ